ncbi:MAG: tyrosine-type recombinase/integrase [Bifidobacteriaceae bacterium]|jgi:site-specific recombinase XerD|nr:tyrosine-type recombinase/integrase [Bifidobacteriaceae bacterium]MCI1914404.1 tyrosine-type recombinase/integrase [Bifidobacteriaceae bacterium]MCI1935856.1 tyrosine-type recombinase/integrase [Bifidobacteriaceae bacterium]
MEEMSFDGMVASYLVTYSGRTLDNYRRQLTKWLEWCDLNQISPLTVRRSHIEAYGAWTRSTISAQTQRSALTVICGLYSYLYEENLIPDDPGASVRRPRIPRNRMSVLTAQQASEFLDAAHRSHNKRVSALCTLLLLNGPRIGETLNLDVENLHDGPPAWLHFTRKFGMEDNIAIGDTCYEELRSLIGKRKHGPIFRNDNNERMTPRQANDIVKNTALSIGAENISPHSLRRTFATLSRLAGVPDYDILATGGWNDPSMLDHYDRSQHAMTSSAPATLSRYLIENLDKIRDRDNDAPQ